MFRAIAIVSVQGFFSTLYCIIMGDLAAKHITIMAKNLVSSGLSSIIFQVTVMPTGILAKKRRRRFYQLVEYTSTLYRCIIPYGRWMSYFTGPQGYDEALITDLGLLTIYTFLKVYLCILTKADANRFAKCGRFSACGMRRSSRCVASKAMEQHPLNPKSITIPPVRFATTT